MKVIQIGQHLQYLSAYNPTDAYTVLLCRLIETMAAELFDGRSVAEVHAMIRERFPQASALLDAVEAGRELPVEYPQNQWPVTPGSERGEIPIINQLKKGRA